MLARGAYGHNCHVAYVLLFLLHDKKRYPEEMSSCNYSKDCHNPQVARIKNNDTNYI